MIDPDETEQGLFARRNEDWPNDTGVTLQNAAQQPRRTVMSTLRLMPANPQTSTHNPLTRMSRAKWRGQLLRARVLGAFAGLFGGVLVPLCGGLLTVAGWFTTDDGARHRLSTTGTALLLLTIPLLMLGACCLDWLEKGTPRPSLKVIRPAEDDPQQN
jgi:hypothetical protein